jgi:hypothetical protein
VDPAGFETGVARRDHVAHSSGRAVPLNFLIYGLWNENPRKHVRMID